MRLYHLGCFQYRNRWPADGAKGYDIAVKAANILKKKKIDFAWYAIGSGRDEETLKKLVATYNLEEQFVFLGRKDNPYCI